MLEEVADERRQTDSDKILASLTHIPPAGIRVISRYLLQISTEEEESMLYTYCTIPQQVSILQSTYTAFCCAPVPTKVSRLSHPFVPHYRSLLPIKRFTCRCVDSSDDRTIFEIVSLLESNGMWIRFHFTGDRESWG